MTEQWKNIIEKINYSEGGITSKVVEQNTFGEVTLFSMADNTSMSEHTSTKAGYVYVIEGKGTFVLEGERIPMKAGVLISMEANAKHSLEAKDKTSFMLILRKVEAESFSMIKPA